MTESPSTFMKDGVRYEQVQSERRLSESLLWNLIEEYYASKSLDAWELVPFYSTNRMMFVGTIAELVTYFLLDELHQLDSSSPIYILELGGGIGSFAFRFVNQLIELMADFEQLKNLKVTYVLSDFARSNIDAHLSNPRLKSLLDSGALEVSVYRPEVDGSITLEPSGKVLKRGEIKNPLIVITNYFFDTIKHDAFRVSNGKLQEAKYSLYREVQPGQVVSLPTFQEIKMDERCHDCTLPYYNDDPVDSILAFYQKNLRDSSVIFPIGGMRAIEKLADISEGKLAMFASDKGFASLDSNQIVGLREQEFVEHGAISFDVNFDALQRYFQNIGGSAQIDSGDHSSLGFIFATSWQSENPLARHYFRTNVQLRDVVNASYNLEEFTFIGCENGKNFERPYLTNFISIVQCANFDPFIFDGAFARLFERLVPELAKMDLEQESEVKDLIERTYKNVFNYGSDYPDLAALFEFCLCWQKYEFCLELTRRALIDFGPVRKAYDYAALSCEFLNRKHDAYEYFRLALELKPDHSWAREGMERNCQ